MPSDGAQSGEPTAHPCPGHRNRGCDAQWTAERVRTMREEHSISRCPVCGVKFRECPSCGAVTDPRRVFYTGCPGCGLDYGGIREAVQT